MRGVLGPRPWSIWTTFFRTSPLLADKGRRARVASVRPPVPKAAPLRWDVRSPGGGVSPTSATVEWAILGRLEQGTPAWKNLRGFGLGLAERPRRAHYELLLTRLCPGSCCGGEPVPPI